MRVGLTYDLKDDYQAMGLGEEACAEFDSIETIDAIDSFLRARGCKTVRIGHIKALTQRLAAGEDWDLVFNIAEGLHGRGREAQTPALLDAYGIPYVFSDPLVLSLTLDKALTKRIIRDAGLPTADFCIWPQPSPLPFPLFVKPLADGTARGISERSLVLNEKDLAAVAQRIEAQFGQPALVETYLPGREFTVGITGTGEAASIVAVMEIILMETAESHGYTYINKSQYVDRVRYRLVDDAEALEAGRTALEAWRTLGCRDGGRVDLRSDAVGVPHFLEVNPLAGLHPVLGDMVILARMSGISYTELLGRMLDSALTDPARFPPVSDIFHA